MNNLKRQINDQLRRRRDLLLNAKTFSIDDGDRETFRKAINGLEKQMYRKVRTALIVISLLVLFSIISGCAKTMQGTGLIFEGFGDAVVAGGQHLQESASKGK